MLGKLDTNMIIIGYEFVRNWFQLYLRNMIKYPNVSFINLLNIKHLKIINKHKTKYEKHYI